MLSRKVLSVCLGVAIALVLPIAFGQRTTGIINGAVSDSSGLFLWVSQLR